jgi:hypothetical protein
MKLTPLQRVKKDFGDRSGLLDAIMPLLGTTDKQVRSSLSGTSNAKLLRIYETAQEVKTRFGSRKVLSERVIELRYPKGKPDDGFVKRVEEATHKRLLDLYRQSGGR